MKKTYFKFYDMLPEPIRSWAKENWSKETDTRIEPATLHNAIMSGFSWHKTPQGSELWIFVGNNYDSKTLLTDAKKKFPELFKPAKPAKTHRIKLKIKKRKDGSWMFSPVGGNGEKLNHQYSNKYGAIRAAIAFKAQMANATIIDEKGRKIEFDL